MSTQVDQLIDILRLLYKGVLKQLAVPLRNPEQYYDDWDDSQVDDLYKEYSVLY